MHPSKSTNVVAQLVAQPHCSQVGTAKSRVPQAVRWVHALQRFCAFGFLASCQVFVVVILVLKVGPLGTAPRYIMRDVSISS